MLTISKEKWNTLLDLFKIIRPYHWAALFILILVYGIGFLSFNHPDLRVTCIISDGIILGHFWDLYDFNLMHLQPNRIAYFPSTYIFFALWNIPLSLIRGFPYYWLGSDPRYVVGVGLYYSKLLPVIIFFLTSIVAADIVRIINPKSNRFLTILFWITLPLSYFSQFIFGSYDIFYIFFMFLGIKYFLRNNSIAGSLFFGISFTFKYFPALVFIPLLVGYCKRKPNLLIFNLLLACAPFAIEFLAFQTSPGFIATVFGDFAGLSTYSKKLFLDGISIGFAESSYLLIGFIFILYFVIFKNDNINPSQMIEMIILSASLFTLFVAWHPQWIIFSASLLALLPFLIPFNKNILNTFLILDWILMFSFTGLVSLAYQWNVDINMANIVPLFRGVNPIIRGETVNLSWFFSLGDHIPQDMALTIYYSFFFSTWVFYLVFYYRNKPHSQKFEVVFPNNEVSFRVLLRFILGALVFLVPAFIALFFGEKLINRSFDLSQPDVNIGEITDTTVIKQTFLSEHEGLDSIGIYMGTYARNNFCVLSFTLLDEQEQIERSKRIPCQIVRDNQIFLFDFPKIRDSKNKTFTLLISSEDASPGNALTAYSSGKDAYSNGEAYVNDQPINKDLSLVLYWANH